MAHTRERLARGRRWVRKRFSPEQDALTAIVPVRSGLPELERCLQEVGRDVRNNPHLRFDSLRIPHFLSWVLLPGERDVSGREGPPRLLFEANFHGPTEAFLEELYRKAGAALKGTFYKHCGLSPGADAGHFTEFFRAHAVRPALLFQSYPGLSVQMIDNDDAVRRFLHQKLAAQPPVGSVLALGAGGSEDERIDSLVLECQQCVRQAVREQEQGIQARPLLDFSVSPQSRFAGLKRRRLMKWIRNLPILPIAGVAFLLLAYEVLRTAVVDWQARGGKGALPPGSPESQVALGTPEKKEALARIQDVEDRQAQNHLALYVELKPGLLRFITLRLILFGWNYLAKHYFTEGTLAGIEGIHFARWVIVDGGWRLRPESRNGRPPRLCYRRTRRGLLFLSNYDGSWESYLDNFIDRASLGLTTIWCNTEGFPRTRLRWNDSGKFPYARIEMGARREEEFKHWVRWTQVPTAVWYSQYPDKSVANIRRNRDIRAQADLELDAKTRKTWLQWL
jgi:hypothetical protein